MCYKNCDKRGDLMRDTSSRKLRRHEGQQERAHRDPGEPPPSKRFVIGTVALSMVLFTAGVALAKTITCPSSGMCEGTPEDDVVDGNDNINYIWSYAGSDRPVNGRNEYDDIHVASGYDTVWAGGVGDTVHGGENGGASLDRLIGQDGWDYLEDHFQCCTSGTAEIDVVCGDDGDDELHIDDGQTADSWWGGQGTDDVYLDEVGVFGGSDVHAPSEAECHGTA